MVEKEFSVVCVSGFCQLPDSYQPSCTNRDLFPKGRMGRRPQHIEHMASYHCTLADKTHISSYLEIYWAPSYLGLAFNAVRTSSEP
jgi:hypothetical protein